MFSRAEREYLETLLAGPVDEAEARLERGFPNPTYRRKLRWGIRRKASASLQDWELYAAAATRERRLVTAATRSGDAPPALADPLASFLAEVRGALRRSGRRLPPGSLSSAPR